MNTTKIIKNERIIKSDKKELLNSLLKQIIDQKLTRLEKKNITEAKTFQTLSNETQNLIVTLENLTAGVRKQIAIQRQKYINSNSKSIKSNSKNKIGPKRIIPKSFSTKRMTNIDSKSNERYNTLQADIYNKNNKSQIIGNKSKSKKKIIKTRGDDTGRKTVAFSNYNNKAGLIPRSKASRKTISPFTLPKETDKLNKTLGNRPSSTAQRRIPYQKRNSISKTEKEPKKTVSKFANKTERKSNLKINTNINNLHNINSLEHFDSNNIDESRIQVLDVFNLSRKNSVQKRHLNISMEINNKKEDKKRREIHKTDFLSNLSKEYEKVGTIKMDEQLIKDSLLVTNNLNGEKSINMDDVLLMREPTIKEFDLSKKDEVKNENNNINDTNKDNILAKASEKMKTSNSSLLIYNKLKRAKVTFLEGEKDIELILKDPKIEDINLNVDVKENDLNTTDVSDQMSLEEKFESNLDIISRYLDMRDICNLMLVNKECLKTIINYLISKTEISIELLQDEIKRLKEINSNIDFDILKKKPFKLSVNSMRAISLLNSSSGINILKLNSEQLNKKEIILVYSLYFVAIGLKKDILSLTNLEKIEYMQNYFQKNYIGQNNFGKFIEKELNGKVFDDKTIFTLYNLSKNNLDIISPNYFQRINKDIAIFLFIIKDLLEQIGLLRSQFLKPDKEFILLNARLVANKGILDELNKIEENIY